MGTAYRRVKRMSKQLLEINKFMNGTVTTPDVSDTPEESASYSLNIDAVIKDGSLQSLPKNRIKYVYDEDGTAGGTAVDIDKIGLIRSEDKLDGVYYDDAQKKIHFISNLNTNSTLGSGDYTGQIVNTTTVLDEHPLFKADPSSTGYSVNNTTQLKNVSMQAHSKELHIGLGMNAEPLWVGYTNHKQFGIKKSTPIIEKAEVKYPSSVPFLSKTVTVSGSTYGISDGGSRIWKINSTTGALIINSDEGTFQNLKSITTDGTVLYVLDDTTTSTYKGVIFKIAVSDLSVKTKIIGLPVTYPGPAESGYTDIEYTSTGSKLWVAAHRDSRIVTNANATADKLLWNFSIPSSNNSVLSSLDNRMPRTSGGGNSNVGTWVSPSPGPSAEVTSGIFGAATNWVMETFPRSLVKHSSDNGAVYWLCRYSDYSSSPIDGLWNMLWLQKSAQSLSSTSGNDWETKAAKVAAYCEIRTLCLNRIPEGHTSGASVNLTMVEHPGTAGGPTANYSDLKGSASASMDAVNIDSCTLDTSNKLFTTIGSSIQRYSTALVHTFNSLATNGPNNNTLGAKKETSYKVTPSGQSERTGSSVNVGHNISSTVSLLRSNKTAGIDKIAGDFDNNDVQTFVIDHSSVSLTFGDVSNITNTGSLQANYEYFYKFSFLFDGYQETNLCTETYPYGQGNDKKNSELNIKIADTTQVPNRASDIIVYRAESPTASATIPASLYRLVKQIPLDTVWTTATDANTGVISADFTHEDVGTKLGSYESSSGLSEDLSDTLPNYSISAQINNFHFIGKCSHPNIDDASTYIFRSKVSKFDTFDWLFDFVKVPTVPTALMSFNGRLWAFDEANTYKIEPNNLFIEDIFEGVGCLNDDAIVSTDFGMFFADDKNIYHLTSSIAEPIGESIVRGSDASGTGNNITAWQNRNKTYYTRAVYDPVRRSVYFSFQGSDNKYYVWAWNIPRKRWDLSSFDDAESTLMPKAVCTLDSGAILWASNDTATTINFNAADAASASKQKLKHYIGHSTLKRNWTWVSKNLTMGNNTQQKRIKDLCIPERIKVSSTSNGTFPSVGDQLADNIASGKGTYRKTVDTDLTKIRIRLDSNVSTDDCSAVGILFKTKRRPR